MSQKEQIQKILQGKEDELLLLQQKSKKKANAIAEYEKQIAKKALADEILKASKQIKENDVVIKAYSSVLPDDYNIKIIDLAMIRKEISKEIHILLQKAEYDNLSINDIQSDFDQLNQLYMDAKYTPEEVKKL